MLGFKDPSLNSIVDQRFYENIIEILIKCSKLMKENCIENNQRIANHEEKITAHLTENYLNNSEVRLNLNMDGFLLKFVIESPENYDINTNTYKGCVDIRVVSTNWLNCSNNNDYYTIECKRLDGKSDLNKKYINEGICRFTIPPVKYPSYHNKNIMFGFIVKNIDINTNIISIQQLHEEKFATIQNQNLNVIKECKKDNYCLCESSYDCDNHGLTLGHLFYDFSSIIA